MPDQIWALFKTLVLEGLTLRAIRDKVEEEGYDDLLEYKDQTLICKMLEINEGVA